MERCKSYDCLGIEYGAGEIKPINNHQPKNGPFKNDLRHKCTQEQKIFDKTDCNFNN